MTSTFAARTKGDALLERPVAVRMRLAEFHERFERGQKLTSAAELWAGVHDETQDYICLHRIWLLARKAQMVKRYDVAEAIYLILHEKTKDERYIRLALAAGERARSMHPQNCIKS
jgi:hypothetical protein